MCSIPDFLRSSQTKPNYPAQSVLCPFWALKPSRLHQRSAPTPQNTYICEYFCKHFSQWNDPSWRNVGGGDFLSKLYTHTHTVHSVLREELTGCRRQLTLLCETQKDTLFLNGTDVFIKSAVKGLHWYRRLIYHRYHRSDKLYRYTSIIQISLTTTSLTIIITLRWFTLLIPVQKIIIMTILNHFMADSYEFVLICKFSNNRLMP